MITFLSRARLSLSPEAKQTAAILKERQKFHSRSFLATSPSQQGASRKPGSDEDRVSERMHKQQEGAKLLYIRPLGEP